MAKPKTKDVDSQEWIDPSESGQNNLGFLKAEAGKTTRIKLMAKPHREYCSYIEKNKIGWVKSLTTYEIKNGKYREIEPGLDQLTTGKPPEMRFIVPVIVYDVDKHGAVPKGTKPADVDYSFGLWAMSANIYERVFAQWKNWGDDLFNHDLLLVGVQKAKFTFFNDVSVAPNAICQHASIAEQVELDFNNYKFSKTFATMCGRKLTEQDLGKLLNGESLDD